VVVVRLAVAVVVQQSGHPEVQDQPVTTGDGREQLLAVASRPLQLASGERLLQVPPAHRTR
jgi:hypothetical protein